MTSRARHQIRATIDQGLRYWPMVSLVTAMLRHQVWKRQELPSTLSECDRRWYGNPIRTDVKRPLVRGSLHAACAIDRLRRREAANIRPRGERSAAAPWRRWFSPDRAPGQWPPSTVPRPAKRRSRLFRPPTDANRIAWQHSLRS